MKIFIKHGILCLFLVLSIQQNSIAQNEGLRFEHIGIEEGLLNERVTAILQDSKGFMWFGTFEGLYKYDGYSFTRYQFDPFDSNSLSQNLIYTIWEDKFGSIWVGTYEGLCKFDRSTEKFSRFKPSPNSEFSDPNIIAVNEDSDGIMWVGSVTKGLCRFDRQNGVFLEEKFDLTSINRIYKDRAGTLWVANATGLHRLDLIEKKTGKLPGVSFRHFNYPCGDSNNLNINGSSVFEDRNGIIWMATGNGLFSFNKNKAIFKCYQHDPQNIHSISSNNMRIYFGDGIKEDLEGNLWMCTDKGINKLDKDRTNFTSYNFLPTDPNNTNPIIITTLEIDESGILWAGSWDGGGLIKVNLNHKAFGLIRFDPNNPNSISNNKVTSIVEDSSGIMWIGTFGGGLNRWDKTTNKFTSFRKDPNKTSTLKSDFLTQLLEDKHGHLWVCNGETLSRLNKKTGEFTHYNCFTADSKGREIFSIAEDHQGLLWLGTGDGIRSFDEKTGTFVYHYYDPKNPKGISDGTSIAIFADSRDNIWVGHGSRGTDKFDKRTGFFTHYKYNPKDSTSISSNIVHCFFEDSKGNIWLGTSAGGFCYFDYEKQKFKTYTKLHGLPDNTVYSILEENENQLWLGTGNGLSKFDPSTKTFTNYDYKDGLQGNIFAAGARFRGARCKDKDGILYFGGSNGFNFFDPAQLKADSHLSPIVITQFKLFDSLVKGANELKEIVLDHDQNYFSFEFSSLSYYNPSKNQYAYKLEGVDKDWVYSGSRRYVAYTNIDPGNYTFRVKGTNNDGVWNDKGTSIAIIINPPWWRTWWAYFMYGLIIITGIFIIIRSLRQRIINKERERTREKELEQAREIEKAYQNLKTTQLQLIQSEKMASLGELTAGIAHEIQNPLNFVNNFSEVNKELLMEMKDEIKKGNMGEAEAIADDVIENQEKINHHGKRADSIVKGMLQHSRASTGQREITDINALVDEYLRLAFHGLRAKDKSFNATMKTYYDESIGNINIIAQDIGRVLLNLYNNAFYAVTEKKKNSPLAPFRPDHPDGPEGGKEYEPIVSVNTKKIGDKVEIRVRDNGNGIPQKLLDKIFQPFFTSKPTGQGTGLGLSLSYDIIKAHSGEIKVETKEGEFAEFIIQLPV